MNFYQKKIALNNIKLFDFLKLLIYMLPISLIIGNSAVNINSFLIIIVFITEFFLYENLIKSYKKIFFIFGFFLFLFFLNILFSSNKIDSSISVLGIIRYFFLMISILYCIEKDRSFLNSFSKFLFLIVFFVAADTLFQYFYGNDIFGIKPDSGHGARLNGPFGDEYVVGAYLSKLFFFSLIYLVIKNKKFIYIFAYLIFILLVTILTKERMASIMLLFTSLVFLIFYSKIKYKIKILFISIFLIASIALISFNASVREHLIFRSLEQIGILNLKNFEKSVDINFEKRLLFDSQWGAHFITAYKIFQNKPLFGSGIKTFRDECKKSDYEEIASLSKDIRCNTHPHNLYLEILSETGILIFVSFLVLNLFFAYKLILNFLIYKEKRDLIILVCCAFIIMFFPIQTTGAFFSTWNGIFYWVVYSLISYILRENEFKHEKN